MVVWSRKVGTLFRLLVTPRTGCCPPWAWQRASMQSLPSLVQLVQKPLSTVLRTPSRCKPSTPVVWSMTQRRSQSKSSLVQSILGRMTLPILCWHPWPTCRTPSCYLLVRIGLQVGYSSLDSTFPTPSRFAMRTTRDQQASPTSTWINATTGWFLAWCSPVIWSTTTLALLDT